MESLLIFLGIVGLVLLLCFFQWIKDVAFAAIVVLVWNALVRARDAFPRRKVH